MGPYAFLPFIVFVRLALKLKVSLADLSKMIFGATDFENRLEYPTVGFSLTRPSLQAVDEIAKDLAGFYVFDFGLQGFVAYPALTRQTAKIEGDCFIVSIPVSKEEAEEIFAGRGEHVPNEAAENLATTTYSLRLTEERTQALIAAFKGGKWDGVARQLEENQEERDNRINGLSKISPVDFVALSEQVGDLPDELYADIGMRSEFNLMAASVNGGQSEPWMAVPGKCLEKLLYRMGIRGGVGGFGDYVLSVGRKDNPSVFFRVDKSTKLEAERIGDNLISIRTSTIHSPMEVGRALAFFNVVDDYKGGEKQHNVDATVDDETAMEIAALLKKMGPDTLAKATVIEAAVKGVKVTEEAMLIADRIYLGTDTEVTVPYIEFCYLCSEMNVTVTAMLDMFGKSVDFRNRGASLTVRGEAARYFLALVSKRAPDAAFIFWDKNFACFLPKKYVSATKPVNYGGDETEVTVRYTYPSKYLEDVGVLVERAKQSPLGVGAPREPYQYLTCGKKFKTATGKNSGLDTFIYQKLGITNPLRVVVAGGMVSGKSKLIAAMLEAYPEDPVEIVEMVDARRHLIIPIDGKIKESYSAVLAARLVKKYEDNILVEIPCAVHSSGKTAVIVAKSFDPLTGRSAPDGFDGVRFNIHADGEVEQDNDPKLGLVLTDAWSLHLDISSLVPTGHRGEPADAGHVPYLNCY